MRNSDSGLYTVSLYVIMAWKIHNQYLPADDNDDDDDGDCITLIFPTQMKMGSPAKYVFKANIKGQQIFFLFEIFCLQQF